MKKASLIDLGLVDYKAAWDFQEELFAKKTQQKMLHQPVVDENGFKHHLIVCQHPNVFTLGKNGKENNLLISKEKLSQQKIDFFNINRGGDITFHGLGQLVVYPILDLEDFKLDIHWYMRTLEEVIIKTLAYFGINGQRIEKETGVWIAKNQQLLARKICAFGVRTSRWVTMHGLALNINTDLKYYDMIVPCGIKDKGVTSMEFELGQKIDENLVKQILLSNFEAEFGVILC